MTRKSQCSQALSLFLAPLTIFVSISPVQNLSAQVAVTRSKLWVHLDEAGMLAFNQPYNAERLSYPGFFGSSTFYNWCWNTPVIGYRAVRQDTVYTNTISNWTMPAVTNTVQAATAVTNYNALESPLGAKMAEIEVTGSVITDKAFGTSVNLPKNVEIEFKHKSMSWSFPKYDDFLITEYTVINRDVESLYNFSFYFAFPLYDAGYNNIDNDTEYIYDANREVFVFYDDRTYTTTAPDDPRQYLYGPGPQTGDVADPGDILAANSIDHQLYNPSAMGIGYVDIPPNDIDIAEGRSSGTVQHLVTRWESSAGSTPGMPHSENLYDDRNVENIPINDRTIPTRYFNADAAHNLKSYRQAKADVDGKAGNVFERQAMYTTSFGPYTLAPGDSLTFTRIISAGALDFNVAALGGVEAAQMLDMDFASEVEGSPNEHAAIKAFRKNWDSALELIETHRQTGYYTPTAVPPPTVGFPPRTGSGDELDAEAAFIQVEGSTEAGARIKWTPVPAGYTDPISGLNDFAGYIVYRSSISIVGAWTAIDTVLAGEEIIESGRVVHEVQAEAGVPYRYGVTSFDSEGLESAMSAYTFQPIFASFAPNDDLTKEVLVVPNPYKQTSGFADPGELKRITLLNIPSQCTIRIYNLARDLVRTLEHDDGTGSEAWGSSAAILDDYMLTEYRKEVAPGLYFYHITNLVPGHKGETAVGKFIIIK